MMEWIGIVIFVVAVGGFIWYRANKKSQKNHTGGNGTGSPPSKDDGGNDHNQSEVS